MTAVNDEGGQINLARDESGEDTIPRTMQKYKGRCEPWMLVADDNCTFSVVILTWSYACPRMVTVLSNTADMIM